MLTIRLARIGRKKQPLYRVVISEKTKDTFGDYLENLGTYNPKTKEVTLKEDRINHWLEKGAQMSSSVNNLLIKQGILKDVEKTKAVSISKKRQEKLNKKEKPEEKKEDTTEKKEEPSKDDKKEEKPEEKKEIKEDNVKEEVVEETKEDK